MPDLVTLANAIANGEGFGVNSQNRPTRNNNPGDLTGTGYVGQTGVDAQGFAVFSSPTDGMAALQSYLQTHLSNINAGSNTGPYSNLNPSSTLAQFLGIYANNPPPSYIQAVANGAGVDPNTTLGQLYGSALLSQPTPVGSEATPSSFPILPSLATTDNGINPMVVWIGAGVIGAILFLLILR